MAEITFPTALWALASGILPALLWLWFWLKEDTLRPEPRELILAAFVGGMLAIAPALFLERLTHSIIGGGVAMIIAWAAIEELVKYGSAYIVAFRHRCIGGVVCLDEPIDPVMYMITAALGFAAGENALFLLTPLARGDTLASIVTGDLRFLGATVLHTVASGAVGTAMGLAFSKSPRVKKIALYLGLCTAIGLHALFNISIIQGQADTIFITFSILWIIAIILLMVFEKIKSLPVR